MKSIIIWRTSKNDTMMNECSDGNKIFLKSKKKCSEIYKRNDLDFVLVNTDDNKTDLIEIHKNYVTDAKQIYDLTEGKVNLFNYNKFTDCILDFFYTTTKIRCNKLDDFEKQMIYQSGGGVRVAEPNYKGTVAKYDYNSFYPWIMHMNRPVPIKSGEFVKITDIYESVDSFYNDTQPKFGFYKAEITPENKKIFTVKKNNWYTSYEIGFAVRHKIPIKLLSDEFYYYSDDCLSTYKKIFGNYIDIFYKIKLETKNKLSKKFLNVLWGILCKMITKTTTCKADEFKLDADEELVDMLPQGDRYIFTYKKKESRYRTNYARIKPWILARGRTILHSKIISFKPENVVFAHTDSFFLKKPTFRTQHPCHRNNLGYIKKEGLYKKAEIINCNKYIL